MGVKTKALTINNVNGGISSDKYLPLPNGLYDAEGVDIGQGKRTLLATNTTNNVVNFGTSIITTLGQTYYGSENGYIYSPTGEVLYLYKSVSTQDYNIRNYITHVISGTTYTLFFGTKKAMRYSPESNISLSWSGSNWTNSSGVRTHTTGNTSVLTGTGTVVASNYYRVKITVQSRTAGSVSVSVGGAAGQTISTNGTFYLFFTTTTTANLTVTPTTGFDGAVNTNLTSLGRQNAIESDIDLPSVSDTCPLLSENGNIYVGNGKYLVGIDNLGTEVTYFSLPDGENINALTKVGDQYVLWVDDGQGGKQYFWDGVSDAPVRTVYWYNERIMNVVNQGAYHIVTTGTDFSIKKVWRSDGYNKVMLYQIPYASFSLTSNKLLPAIPLWYGGRSRLTYVNAIESLGDLVFLPAYEGVISLGKKKAGFPDAINVEWKLQSDEILAMYAYNDNLYVSYLDSDGTTCKVTQIKLVNNEDVLDTTDDYYFTKLGHITYTPIVFNASQNKSGKNIKLGYNLPDNDTFINIYYALDREVNYYTFVIDESVNPVTTDPTVGAVYRTSTNARYAVTKVTKQGNFMFIETQETVREQTPRVTSTLTKISGTGDSTITYVKFHNYKHLDIVTDMTTRKHFKIFPYDFTEVQFRIELATGDGAYSPEVNDFTLVFDEEQND